jgi:serine/threonine protein phosphatase PrpC
MAVPEEKMRISSVEKPADADVVFKHRRNWAGDFTRSFLRSSSSLTKWSKEKSSAEITVGELHLFVRYGERTIQGHRPSQEDAHTATTNLERRLAKEGQSNGNGASGPAFFAIFDGHGGRGCSDFLAQHLHTFFAEAYAAAKGDSAAALRSAMDRAEREWLAFAAKDECVDGSTACVAVLDHSAGELTVANVGDSEAVLCRAGLAMPLTEVHNPSRNGSEASRVRAAGGVLQRERVCHPVYKVNSLAVSRAMGDLPYKSADYTGGKPSGVIAEPSMKQLQLQEDDDFLLIACDGLWDVMSHDQAVEFCSQRLRETDDPQRVAEELVEKALEDGSFDNISALLVTFKSFNDKATGSQEASVN